MEMSFCFLSNSRKSVWTRGLFIGPIGEIAHRWGAREILRTRSEYVARTTRLQNPEDDKPDANSIFLRVFLFFRFFLSVGRPHVRV